MEHEILSGKSKSIRGTNETNVLPLDVSTTFKPLVLKDLKETVDLYSVYREEYGKCQNYRITLTIKPYCTNVLFNTCTEVVKGEGSDDCIVATDGEDIPTTGLGAVYGRNRDLRRAYMVSNTEYSSPEIGFSYYPGYDIFDNHTLRNLSFRPVMRPSGSGDSDVFNTMADFMRTKDGNKISFYPRFSYSDVENNSKLDMHIYEHSNTLSFTDGSAIDANLMVENGWFGFKNASSISEPEEKGNVYLKGVLDDEHIFSHTINNVGNCDFVDMFPDRTRYSFVPHYNEDRNRYEKNWDIFLTYPWKNFYNHNLVNNIKPFRKDNEIRNGDADTNAILVLRVLRTRLSNNRKTMLFRTFCKHGVSINDKVAVYVSKNYGENFTKLPKEYVVDYVGDYDGNNKDYFFGISSKTFLNDLFYTSIESKFYDIYNEEDGNTLQVSGRITDVPEGYSNDVIRVYRYVDSPNLYPYVPEMTFDSMPKTINADSPAKIRVWDGESYSYYTWSDGIEKYEGDAMNCDVQYGDWNTFTDVPEQRSARYIRVKVYTGFYTKNNTRRYRTKENLDTDKIINDTFSVDGWQIRFARVANNNIECKYYIRQFRKVPNFKNSSEPLPVGLCENTDKFLRFVSENASDSGGQMLEYDSETYRLAFSKTIYGDDVAQVTFLDTMNIQNLTDNLGRPVTEIYATVVKRNKGYKEWYGEDADPSSPDVEYSRCFGSVTSGLEYLDLDDVFDRTDDVWVVKGRMSSATSLYNCTQGDDCPISLEEWDDENENGEILETDDVFFGDVVEFDPVKCKETKLSDVCFRFNTAQREVGRDGDDEDFNFTYHELDYDDYDPIGEDDDRTKPFRLHEYRQWNCTNINPEQYIVYSCGEPVTIHRNEGYYYKPHTRIPLLRFSDKVSQDSHRTLRIKEIKPIQADAMYISAKTYTPSGLGGGTVLYVVDGDNWYETTIAYVIDKYTFAFNPITKNDAERKGLPYLDWVVVCDGISSGSMKLRVKNEGIPSYASKVDENVFLWRDVVNPGDLPENDSYKHPFSNGSFYVDSHVNLYLRRQDPDGINGLYCGENIPDIEGKIFKETNNEYKEEDEFTC